MKAFVFLQCTHTCVCFLLTYYVCSCINPIRTTGITSCWHLWTWELYLACDLNVWAPQQNSNPQVKHTDIFLWRYEFTREKKRMCGTVSLKLKAKEILQSPEMQILRLRPASIIANAKTSIVFTGSWIKTFIDIMPVWIPSLILDLDNHFFHYSSIKDLNHTIIELSEKNNLMCLHYYANGYKFKLLHITAVLSLCQRTEFKLYSFHLLFLVHCPFFPGVSGVWKWLKIIGLSFVLQLVHG